MRVALYAYRLAKPEPVGVDRYVAQLTRALWERNPQRYSLMSSAEDARPIWAPADMPLKRLPGPRRALHLSWYLTGRPRIDRYADRADLLHVLVPTWPVPSRMPVVYTLHDIMPLDHPEWFPRRDALLVRAAFRDAAARAVRIVVVSDTVAEAAANRLAIERERITVVHNGVADRFRSRPSIDELSSVCSRFGLEPGRYVIYVGQVDTHKNVAMLVRAIARRGPGARLLVAGPMGFGAENVIAEVERLNLTADVIMPGYVEDANLPALMAGAIALVHPSEYEGFGLTPLEAMSLGTPVIASRAGALPEVLGDSAVLLDPHDVDGWAAALTRVERDHDHAKALGTKGQRHALHFTWERAAEKTAAVYETILSN